MTSEEKTMERLDLKFKWERDTKRTSLFKEELGDEAYSDKDIAVDSIYVQQQALELIGNPKYIRVIIEPIESASG